MRKLSLLLLIPVVAWAVMYMGCMDRKPAPVCPVPLELADDDVMVGGFDGVDMLVIVDNSSSMLAEQQILATSFFPLVNSLVHPLPGWEYPAANNVRIAVVSSDMGLSYGGVPYQNGDGWPGGAPPAGCSSAGDNGQFFTSTGTVDVEQDTIPCGADASQCPTGWTCDNIGSGGVDIGYCHDGAGDGTNITCPPSPSALGMLWTETLPESVNDELAFTAACMTSLGTNGCGFEQQLQSAGMALSRADQVDFVRENKLLVVLTVSDEEDCSMDDGPGLFASDEVVDSAKWNIACGVSGNQQFLYAPSHYYDIFKAAKGNEANSVVFAAIVGVPTDEDGPSPCQGSGDQMGSCLDHPAMQLTERTEINDQGDTVYFWEYACERGTVTQAYPGRRYVELAQEYGPMGYIYSICNEDWSPAMKEIASLIASNLSGTCYEKPLDYDPAVNMAKCDVVVEYSNVEECPAEFEDDDPIVVEVQNGDVMETRLFCTLPQLEANQDCAAIADPAGLDLTFGWYYCENLTGENFNEACNDGQDNDGDGNADCLDDQCAPCTVCGGNGVGCSQACKYQVKVTDLSEQEVKGRSISVQCILNYSFEDPNCQEDRNRTCNDGIDNDGNGVYDCNTVTSDDATEDNPAHNPDPNCCPMDPNTCEILPEAHDNCDFGGGTPSACYKMAEALGCSI